MNREHFFIELKLYLKQLPLDEQQIVIDSYQTIFDEQTMNGQTEYEITAALPTPREIALTTLDEMGIVFEPYSAQQSDWEEITDFPIEDVYKERYQPYHQSESGFQRGVQIIGLLALNGFFMIWVILTLLLVLFSGWLLAAAFLFSPLVSLFIIATTLSTYAWFQFFVTILLFGFGLLGALILIPITKGSIKLLTLYTKWNIAVINGGHN